MYFNSTNNYFLFNRYKSFKLKSQFKCKTVIAFTNLDKVTATDVYENLEIKCIFNCFSQFSLPP